MVGLGMMMMMTMTMTMVMMMVMMMVMVMMMIITYLLYENHLLSAKADRTNAHHGFHPKRKMPNRK